MNCSKCNNNMYSASIDCVDRTLTIQYTSGSNTHNNDMPNWTGDDHCALIHNNTNQYGWWVYCNLSVRVG